MRMYYSGSKDKIDLFKSKGIKSDYAPHRMIFLTDSIDDALQYALTINGVDNSVIIEVEVDLNDLYECTDYPNEDLFQLYTTHKSISPENLYEFYLC